jgi:hypothetical protein
MTRLSNRRRKAELVYVVAARANKTSEPYLVGVFDQKHLADSASAVIPDGWTSTVRPTALNVVRQLPGVEKEPA